MKLYKTFITPSYVPDWEVEDAVREYITNALDSPAPFDFTYDEDNVYITSRDTTLDVSSFLLGVSKNRGMKESVGTHAEGSLVAMGILLRNNIALQITNGDGKIWTPEFIHDEDLDSEILTIVETINDDPVPSRDYTVRISGLNKEEVQTIISRCLYLQSEEDLGKIGKCDMGRVLFDQKGKLYVGGVWVTDTNLDYSYDFHPQYLKLNRDRKSVEHWDLKTNVANMLQLVESSQFVAELVTNNSPDVVYMQYVPITPEVKEECFKFYQNKYAGSMLVSSQHEKENLTTAGYSDIIVENDNFVSVVKSSQSYKDLEWERSQESPVELLERLLEESNTMNWVTLNNALQELTETFRERKVKWGG